MRDVMIGLSIGLLAATCGWQGRELSRFEARDEAAAREHVQSLELKIERGDMGSSVTLPSGKKLYANNGIISIDAELGVTHGYDGDLPAIRRSEWMDDDEWAETEKLTSGQQVELADIMLDRWRRFRDRAAKAVL